MLLKPGLNLTFGEISGRSAAFQLRSHPAGTELTLTGSRRLESSPFSPLMLKCPAATSPFPLRPDFPSPSRFHSAFSLLPPSCPKRGVPPSPRKPPLADGQRAVWGCGVLGAHWVCHPLPGAPGTRPPRPAFKPGSSERPRPLLHYLFLLISLLFPVPLFLPHEVNPRGSGARPVRDV